MRIATDHGCRGLLKSKHWVLCLGAGVNRGLLPNWNELAWRLFSDAVGTELLYSDFERQFAKVGWPADSWIQAALNIYQRNGLGITRFLDRLEIALYSDLLHKAKQAKLESAVIQAFNARSHLKRQEVNDVLEFFCSFEEASVVEIADALIDSIERNRAPAAIINFNADPILFTILSLKLLQRDFDKPGLAQMSPLAFARVGQPDQLSGDGIPIFHVHGSLFPPSKRTKNQRRRDARNFLIFPEISYHKMAGNLSSWSQATYLHYAYTHNFLFLGLSLSDPNIRRWMGWKYESHTQNRLEHASDPKALEKIKTHPFRQNYWIRTIDNTETSQQFFDAALDHLGIEILAIHKWADLHLGMRNLLSLRATTDHKS